MGTVGLSFGSPTSGAGFDVSSTVAEIVSNLQNVETPWKTQLTALQSQDTAISSLGTLFSNLSNDLSSLTDFQGVMALKEGSSSNPDVLTLTAADQTAIAGTHTVTVTNLAQTSSGYLTQIGNANDPLSGSITVQGADGTQLSITLNSSNNTLAGLAATINSSGLGINASVLIDAGGSMLSLVSATSGADGDISVPVISLVATNSAALNYSGAAGNGTQASTGALAPLANTSDTLSGSMSIQVGSGSAETIVIGGVPSSGPAAHTLYTGSGKNTLTDLENTITLNPSVLGVTASIVTSESGAQNLSITSNTPGSIGTLNVVSKINEITGTTSLSYSNPVSGKDAIHLQARLRMDVGGRPAQVLSEFYASIFAQILQASQSVSRQKFEHAIDCVKNVRDAWREVARDPEVNPAPAQVAATPSRRRQGGFDSFDFGDDAAIGSRWNAYSTSHNIVTNLVPLQ
jgi:flagellar hook-associated protein 2